MNERIAYHLRELEIAGDPASALRVMPEFAGDGDVLDLGCGIGQTLVAIAPGPGRRVGLDIDAESLAFGRSRFPQLELIRAAAEALPLAANSFDLIVSRVSLPYTRIPSVLAEAARVLRAGGDVWFTLHDRRHAWRDLRRAFALRAPRDMVFRVYVLLNGLVFHLGGALRAMPGTGRIESFQSDAAMRRELIRAGFVDIVFEQRGKHRICRARRPPVRDSGAGASIGPSGNAEREMRNEVH